MKLEFPQVDVKSSRAFENENFSLGDVRVIMDLLSSKIYARPKYIIIQEVSSNARDANREAGCPDIPVEIKLPNRFDDNLRIRDNGPGISPSRMSDVFLKYGNSTKRSDNVQTGGFGIGAKTPFTYTDTFNVVTVTIDEDGRHRRIYIAHKASNGAATMDLITTEEVDDSIKTGTEISFAVHAKDFDSFTQAAREVCRFWKPRPNVTGSQNGWTWPEDNILHDGKGWALASSGSPTVLIDGIPYSLRLEAIFTDRNSEIYKILSKTAIRMYFNTGEIEVSATREDLDYKDKTINAVKARAAECLAELRSKVSASIAGAKTLWDATIMWEKNSAGLRNFLVEPTWNGLKLLPRSMDVPYSININPTVYPEWHKERVAAGITLPVAKNNYSQDNIDPREHVKISVFIMDDQGSIISHKRWGRSPDNTLVVSDDYLIVEDDVRKTRANRLRLQTLFEKHPSKSKIAVVVNKTDSQNGKDFLKYCFQWDQIPKIILSTVPKAKNTRKNGGSYTVNAVKVLGQKSGSRATTKEWTGDKTRAPEDTKGGVYVILQEGKPTLSDGTVLEKHAILALSSEWGQEIYGILYKYRNKISSSWTDLLSYNSIFVQTLTGKPTVQNRIKFGSEVAANKFGSYLEKALYLRKSEINSQVICDYINDSRLSIDGENDYDKLTNMLRRMQQSNLIPKLGNELETRSKAIFKVAPLLEKFRDLNSYSLRDKDVVKEIIFYINQRFKDKPSTDGSTPTPTN